MKPEPDLAWRAERVELLVGPDLPKALDALLSLVYFDPDREWLERLLSDLLQSDCDFQLRRLALVCMGHIARLHGCIGSQSKALVASYLADPVLGGTAEDALGDIDSFAEPE